MTQTRGMFSSIVFALQVGPVAEGDLVPARWTCPGTTADGRTVAFVGNDLLRVVDGRVVEYWPASPPPLPTPPSSLPPES